MKFHVLTLFPEHIDQGLNSSILKKAREKGLIELNLVNIRDYANNKHCTVDDYPYGGGAGMVMQAPPVVDSFYALKEKHPKIQRVLYMSPQGKPLNQEKVIELAKEEELVFLCGHYEGIDERAIEEIVTEEVSIGDYILTGGELAAMVVIDAVSRHVEGVLSNSVSKDTESFDDHLLEYPQYTRPYDYKGQTVPEVLLSGNHKNIDRYRREESLRRTALKRPDLLVKANLDKKDKLFLKNICHIDINLL
ncbi:MAG: tRNA (guanosine(37)-N1)-methyltransferase TrmD [Vallitaleaceae bacterium]|nr:tRNA (guanosine(37)-N1)-methyltransferase TrmD [Vallitaleaceae bacterium]